MKTLEDLKKEKTWRGEPSNWLDYHSGVCVMNNRQAKEWIAKYGDAWRGL